MTIQMSIHRHGCRPVVEVEAETPWCGFVVDPDGSSLAVDAAVPLLSGEEYEAGQKLRAAALEDVEPLSPAPMSNREMDAAAARHFAR